ncbi:MAG TPA: hypothetical protein VFI31_00935 [Pirellulales bacterium]|nr:hypothetical protein [Pirellulales bacterium]
MSIEEDVACDVGFPRPVISGSFHIEPPTHKEGNVMHATIDLEHADQGLDKASFAERVIPLPTVLSVFAVLVSLAALAWSIYHDPLRAHLGRYDFSTPKSSLISLLQLQADNDIGSSIALERLYGQRAIQEKLRTISVFKEAEWRGNKILFVSYESDGMKKYSMESFTKDADTGLWRQAYVSSFSVGDSDNALSAMMKSWEEKGRLE